MKKGIAQIMVIDPISEVKELVDEAVNRLSICRDNRLPCGGVAEDALFRIKRMLDKCEEENA